ncbi:MAG TPA: GyrI-like domain-containing protein [Candidatus Nanoarchaeia archaeon]|nr:GyrI-like domain-containing protein [Candidatus Nanoarchaeia archaeon]
MVKIDFKKEYKDLYSSSSKEVVIVEVPAFNYLMIDGVGNPNTSQPYREAVETLFAVSYALKFMVKKSGQAVDYGVLPLEGLWWADSLAAFVEGDKDKWKWTAMIMQPKNLVTDLLVKEAVDQVQKKKNLPALGKLRFEEFDEGLAVQIMHLGPFSEEKTTVENMRVFIKRSGYVPVGKHHEIYLSDPRKVAPERLKTVLRQPIKK